MVRSFFHAMVAVLVAGLAAVMPEWRQDVVTPARLGSIHGRVLDADRGGPLADARVFLTGSSIAGRRLTVSDEQGAYEFADLPAGRFQLSVLKPPFVMADGGSDVLVARSRVAVVQAGAAVEGIDFPLRRGAAVAGRVINQDGRTMPDIRVELRRVDSGERAIDPLRVPSVRTNAEGRYRLFGLQPGTYRVLALPDTMAPSYAPGVTNA